MDIKPYATNPYADLYLLAIGETGKMPEGYFTEHFPDRYTRAQRFKATDDRMRCLAAGMLLYEAAGLTDADICTGEHGKPYAKAGKPYFSLSHSGDYVLLAVSGTTEIGADIERIGRKVQGKSLVKWVCTPEEQEWMAVDALLFNERFYRIWTMKESVSKALGLGLALPFDSFSVLPLLDGRSLELDGHIFSGETRLMGSYAISCAWISDIS